ncbi:MAG: hypothetical protein J6A89_05425 [Clostridia bacterium]|nr:hypothetical protein [Clostridia bacterium]
MDIDVKKGTKNWNLTIKKDNENIKFDYIKFIDLLYNGEEINNINFDKDILDEEKIQLEDMINEINSTVRAEKHEEKQAKA